MRGGGTVICPPSKDNGLIFFRDSTALMVLYLVHYDTLLQNAAVTTIKSDSYFITKCFRLFITKCDSFITQCDS